MTKPIANVTRRLHSYDLKEAYFKIADNYSKVLVFILFKPGFHIIAPVATIAAVVEKRVSATVAIYGNTLFSDSSVKYDSDDERR